MPLKGAGMCLSKPKRNKIRPYIINSDIISLVKNSPSQTLSRIEIITEDETLYA